MHALSQPPLHPGSDRQLSPGQQELRSLWGKTVLRQNVLLLDKGRQCWRKASKEGSHSSHPDFTGEAAKVGAAATVTYSGGKNQDNHRDTAYILAKEHPGCLGTSKKKKKQTPKTPVIPTTFNWMLTHSPKHLKNVWQKMSLREGESLQNYTTKKRGGMWILNICLLTLNPMLFFIWSYPLDFELGKHCEPESSKQNWEMINKTSANDNPEKWKECLRLWGHGFSEGKNPPWGEKGWLQRSQSVAQPQRGPRSLVF